MSIVERKANKMATDGQNVLGVVDYVILVLFLLISCAIGVYFRFTGGKQKTATEYLLADKNMSIFPVAFSLMASFMSAITLLGLTSEVYVFGFQWIVINIAYGIFTPIVAYVYLPVFFKLQATSAYEEYLLADKNMSIFPVAFSLMASFMSAVTLLGVSSEIYVFGLQFVIINISYGLFTPIAAYLYLPVFFKLQATSAYEYLEKRFGKIARLMASLSYSVQMILYMGIVLYAPALALEALTGIMSYAAILSVGLVCTFYSTIGGMKAVLITDVFQSLLTFAAVFAIIIYAAIDLGGLDQIWYIAERGGRTELLHFNPDPTFRHSWFTLIIGGGLTFLTLYGVNQTQVQRYLTIKDLKNAQKAVWLNWPILSALSLTTSFAGLAIFARYHSCDPVADGAIDSSDQLMPYFVVDTMGHIPGLTGLFVSGLFSAALSTVSAALNSLAAVTMEDYFKPAYKKIHGQELSEKQVSLYSKIAAFIYGLVCLGVAFLAGILGGVLQASITIFGVIGGPLLGLFTLGMFTTTGNEIGGTTGLLIGIGMALWMAFGTPRPSAPTLPVSVEGCVQPNGLNLFSNSTYRDDEQVDNSEYFWLYRVSYLYNVVFGLLVSFIVGYVVSFIVNIVSKEKKKNMDPNLFIEPIARRLKKKQQMEQNNKG